MLNRRSFFGMLFGGLLCKFLPKPKPELLSGTAIRSYYMDGISRVDFMDTRYWDMQELLAEPSNPEVVKEKLGLHQCSVAFVSREGYVTAPSPVQKWTAVSQLPVGPPNVGAKIVEIS